ncbi:hypothetical protein BO83DRAFT_315179, partial [Aspergillus eucalypticola CBS 122712]
AVVIPAILYRCSAWYTLGTDNGHCQIQHQILTQIYRRAMRAIKKIFRATAITIMNIETYLLPMQ